MDLASFTRLDHLFFLCAALGAVAALLRVVFLFASGDLGEDAPELDDPGTPGAGFHYLSIHGLSSFFMMFGLVGLALDRQSWAGAGLELPEYLGRLLPDPDAEGPQ
jgi:hypothetical protein